MVSLENTAKIVYRPDGAVGKTQGEQAGPEGDDFFSAGDVLSPQNSALKNFARRVFDDITELIREKKWEDIAELYHPVDEKLPELAKADRVSAVREKTAFALGQLKRFDEAIVELEKCVISDPDNFYVRASLAYTAYNSLYAAKNREIFLAGDLRAERIRLAHENFKKARQLRPDNVTNFYREGMLFSQIENKPDKAFPFFEKACLNWESLDENEKAARSQEKKNYIKSLYRLGSLLLERGEGEKALERVSACLNLDEKTGYISLAFKYFALGKVHFHLGNYEKARDALMFANQSGAGPRDDFVAELLARTYLALGKKEKALKTVRSVPGKFRRPYVRWTEADVLCTLNRYEEAERTLESALEKDGRSKHKSLMKLAKIRYLMNTFEDSRKYAEQASTFFREKWGGLYREGIFMQAVSLYRLGRLDQAQEAALELKRDAGSYPRLGKLLSRIEDEKKK